jgi:hypothetical protein
MLERVRALLLDGNLPKALWAECVSHVTDLINMTPSSSIGGKTPYELWYCRKPSVQFLKVFGCAAYAHIPDAHRDKLAARAHTCMYLRQAKHKEGYRLMNVQTHTIVYSRYVVFNEHEFPQLANVPIHSERDLTSMEQSIPTEVEHAQIFTRRERPELVQQLEGLPPLVQEALRRAQYTLVGDTAFNCTPQAKRRRLDDETKVTELNSPLDLEATRQHLDQTYALLSARYIPEPSSLRGAMSSDHAAGWRQAAGSEYKAHLDNGTWTLVPPSRRHKLLRNRCKVQRSW